MGETFYVLEEGCAIVTQSKGGVERELRRIGEYACFGERALLTAEARSANVVAETRVGTRLRLPCFDAVGCCDWLLLLPVVCCLSGALAVGWE